MKKSTIFLNRNTTMSKANQMVYNSVINDIQYKMEEQECYIHYPYIFSERVVDELINDGFYVSISDWENAVRISWSKSCCEENKKLDWKFNKISIDK